MDYNCLYKVPNPQCIHISFLLTYHYSLIWNKLYLFNVFILLDLPPKITVLSSGEFCLHCDFCLAWFSQQIPSVLQERLARLQVSLDVSPMYHVHCISWTFV